jgi:hypothetical protein
MVCQHGFKTSSESNEEVVIDIDTLFVNLGDLVDLVSPRKQLVNVVAEVGIQILKEENTNPKKYIVPLRIAVSSPLSSYVSFLCLILFIFHQLDHCNFSFF